jgi:hypothetical protein
VNGHFLKLHFCMYVLPKFNNKWFDKLPILTSC